MWEGAGVPRERGPDVDLQEDGYVGKHRLQGSRTVLLPEWEKVEEDAHKKWDGWHGTNRAGVNQCAFALYPFTLYTR